MKRKTALITGITGQDGSYLSEFLISKNYIVHGIIRRSSLIKTERIDHLINDPKLFQKNLYLHYGDMTDNSNLSGLITRIKPDEIYNLAAQSHVKVSFETPEYTANCDALGALRILEAVYNLKLLNTKIYQASTSEMFGKTKVGFVQNEKTPFHPQSPYGAAKLYAYWITKIYRESYNMFACNGILFNHESPKRGPTFVTKKIIDGVNNYLINGRCFELGNIYSYRDFGHAKDYIESMWKILQLPKPDDFVIATGNTITIKEFVNKCLKYKKINYKWIGKDLKTKCIDIDKNKTIISINKRLFRPLEVDYLKGDFTKAKKVLKWKPKFKVDDLIKDMFEN